MAPLPQVFFIVVNTEAVRQEMGIWEFYIGNGSVRRTDTPEGTVYQRLQKDSSPCNGQWCSILSRSTIPPTNPDIETRTMDFTVLDVETANPDYSSICQIGIAGRAWAGTLRMDTIPDNLVNLRPECLCSSIIHRSSSSRCQAPEPEVRLLCKFAYDSLGFSIQQLGSTSTI